MFLSWKLSQLNGKMAVLLEKSFVMKPYSPDQRKYTECFAVACQLTLPRYNQSRDGSSMAPPTLSPSDGTAAASTFSWLMTAPERGTLNSCRTYSRDPK